MMRPSRGAAITALFLAITVLSSGDLIEIIPLFAPFVAGPLFPFVHETHDILAVMLALYAAHKLTPAVGTRAVAWFLALHLLFAYFGFLAHLPELVRIALTGAAAFLGIYIISLRKRAEQRMWLQATALDAAANAIFITDRQGVIEWVNPAFTRLTGHSAEEAIGQTPRIIKSGKHTRAFYETLWDTILAGEVWQAEMVNRSRDGGLFHVHQTITPLRGTNGEISHFVAIQQDINERMQMEQALRNSEEAHRMVLNGIDEIVYQIRLSADNPFEGSIEFVSERTQEVLGYRPVEFMADPKFWFSLIHPEDIPALQAQTIKIMTTGRAGIREYRILDFNGNYRWMEDRVVPEIDEEGRVVRIFGVVRDITERIQVQQALLESEKMYREVVENASDIIYSTDRNGKFTYANPAALRVVGYSLEELRKLTYLDIIQPDYRRKVQTTYFRQFLGKLTSPYVEFPFQTKSGEVRWFGQNASAVQDGQSTVGFQVIARDITERVRAERRLATQYAVARALAESATLAEAAPQLLQGICESLDWDQAEMWSILWSADAQANVLRCTGTWHPPSLSFPEFETATRQIELPPGVGLPGRAWSSGEPAWIPDVTQDANFRRASMARKEGLHAGFAFPIQLGGQVLGVMGFLSREIRPPDDDTLQMLTSVSSQIGRFIGGKQGEEALRESEERYRTLVETAPDSIFAVSLDGALVSLNPAFETLTGWPREEYLGKPFALLLHPDNLTAAMELFQRILQGETLPPLEWRIRHKSGDYTSVEVTTTPQLEQRQVVGLMGIARDLTERKQAEKEIQSLAQFPFENPYPVLRIARNGALLYVNPAGLIQLPGWNLQKGETAPVMLREIVSRLLSTGSAQGVDLEHGDRVYSFVCAPVVNASYVNLYGLDVTERKRAENRIQDQLRRLAALHAIDAAITGSFNLQLTLKVVLEEAANQLGIDAASILLLNPETQMLAYTAALGFHTETVKTASIPLGESFAGLATLERRLIQVLDLATAQENPDFADLWINEGFSAYYVTPLIVKGQVKGVLEVFQRTPLTQTSQGDEWLNFLETLAGQAAIAVDNANLFEGLQQANTELTHAYEATIAGWSQAMDLRDKETEGHTLRVTALAERLARAIGINDDELIHFRRGGLLHDIGKIGVPDDILLNPDKLTDEELVHMKKHPQFAFDMLSPIAYLKPALDIPYCHHEKWDGSGYPRGLKGEEIPLTARIFAVVDVFDALTSDRPYRPAWTKRKTAAYIRQQAGIHFDPKVVDIFLIMIRKK